MRQEPLTRLELDRFMFGNASTEMRKRNSDESRSVRKVSPPILTFIVQRVPENPQLPRQCPTYTNGPPDSSTDDIYHARTRHTGAIAQIPTRPHNKQCVTLACFYCPSRVPRDNTLRAIALPRAEPSPVHLPDKSRTNAAVLEREGGLRLGSGRGSGCARNRPADWVL